MGVEVNLFPLIHTGAGRRGLGFRSGTWRGYVVLMAMGLGNTRGKQPLSPGKEVIKSR